MENEELYPELREYIFQYCGKYFWNKRELAQNTLGQTANAYQHINFIMYSILTRGGEILKDNDISELTNDGYEAYKIRMAERIFNEHKGELELNLCPACGKIARTPKAKQCQFCFHNWH